MIDALPQTCLVLSLILVLQSELVLELKEIIGPFHLVSGHLTLQEWLFDWIDDTIMFEVHRLFLSLIHI